MRYEEHQHQEAFVRYVDMQYPSLCLLLVHIPNGQNSNARVGARYKRLGLRPGVPDLVFFAPRQGYHALFIEMKSAKGRCTPAQLEYHRLLISQDYKVEVAYSFDEARKILDEYIGC